MKITVALKNLAVLTTARDVNMTLAIQRISAENAIQAFSSLLLEFATWLNKLHPQDVQHLTVLDVSHAKQMKSES